MFKLKILNLFLAPLCLKIRGRIVGAFSKITMAIYIGFGLLTLVSITLFIILANLQHNSGMSVGPQKNVEQKMEQAIQEQPTVIVTAPKTVVKTKEVIKEQHKDNDQEASKEIQGAAKPIKGSIQLEFGWQLNPIYNDWRYHTGIDIKGSNGQSVEAVYKGKVTDVFRSGHSGLTVVITDNTYEIYYCSLASTTVEKGSFVSANQVIGKMGSWDGEPYVHLHLSIKKDQEYIDPTLIITMK